MGMIITYGSTIQLTSEVDAKSSSGRYYYIFEVVGNWFQIGDKSSEFDAKQSRIRKDKKYIYEPFLPTGGMDVKVYMVGEMYSHAEARK